MSNFTLNTKIILRNDTAENWTRVNPTLTKGEVAIEVDTKKIKIGDGTTQWSDLGYANVTPEEIENLGVGDMTKAEYDSNGDGKVDRADLADRATTADTATTATNANEAKVAVKLKTPVNIAGVSFDGSASIELTKANVGLGNVDNTSDLDKPISTATQSALNAIKGDAGEGVTLGTVDAKAKANATAITALQGKVQTVEEQMATVEETVDAQNTKITAVEEKATANETAITGLTGRVETVEGKVTAQAGEIATVKQKVTTAEGKITALETKVDVDSVSEAISTAVQESEAKLGTSATKNVGTEAGNVVEVQGDGKIATSLIPSVAITDTFTADSEEAMLALSQAEKGDVCIRTDINKTFILAKNGYATLDNWKELKTPTDAVQSVNGQKGAVVLNSGHIAEGSNKYYTEERVNANFRGHSSAELTDGASIIRNGDTLTLNGGNAE